MNIEMNVPLSAADPAQKALWAAAYGQTRFGTAVVDGYLDGDGVLGAPDLPWDAYAEVKENGEIWLHGTAAPGGSGGKMSAKAPDYVSLVISVWDR